MYFKDFIYTSCTCIDVVYIKHLYCGHPLPYHMGRVKRELFYLLEWWAICLCKFLARDFFWNILFHALHIFRGFNN